MANEPSAVKDPHGVHIVRSFHHAVSILDATEPQMRDLIEGELMDVAGINRTKISDARLAADAVVQKIVAIRVKAMKDAFRHLRDQLPSDL